jgi:hypothetical protein
MHAAEELQQLVARLEELQQLAERRYAQPMNGHREPVKLIEAETLPN